MTGPTDELTCVVGASGLLGSAVVRRLRADRRARILIPDVPWSDGDRADQALRGAVDDLVERANGGRWRLLWCAGAGVPASPAGLLEEELRRLEVLLSTLAERRSGDLSGPGALFFASSAGAVYAGSRPAPFDERAEVSPLSHYGHAKIAAEQLVRRFAERSGVPTLIGRISNLYGPGQNLAKAQGVISHICRSYVTAEPISIYVSLDTVRDYLYVDDAAGMVLDGLAAVRDGAHGSVVLKVLASQQPVTLAALLGECRRVFKRKPRVILGSSPYSAVQAHDLRMRSVVLPELDARPFQPLAAGLRATAQDLATAAQRGRLGRPR